MHSNHYPQTDIPTILVVLGATGDLMKKKIISSIYHLYVNQRLSSRFCVVGAARREYTNTTFREKIYADLLERLPNCDKKRAQEVCQLFAYSRGDLRDVSTFKYLKAVLSRIDAKWGVCTNKLFYLAVSPHLFEIIFKNMALVGLNTPCGGALGWTRMLIEKPFGKDTASARTLFKLLAKYFKEEQLYLIDHYAVKEIIQAILHFRFSNNLFERSWDRSSIERIDIRLLETIGVEDRGSFYDTVGALQDVGQNHLLQMLAAVTMDTPRANEQYMTRTARAECIEKLKAWTLQDIKKYTFRARYKGYADITGVAPHSQAETYFKLQTELTHPSWREVPLMLEAGKRCAENKKEIVVTFKHPSLCVACTPQNHIHNRVVFSMTPQDKITIYFWTKVPGFEKKLEERAFHFFLYEHPEKTQYVEEYAEIIFNCLIGDQGMFVSQREIMAQWRFSDPLGKAWKKNIVPLAEYAPDTDEARVASEYIGKKLEPRELQKDIAFIGLGKMGANLSRRMMDYGWRVAGYNRSREKTDALAREGLIPAYTLRDVILHLPKKKIVWLMVPAGKAIDEILFRKGGLVSFLKKGDVVIDGGNSFYKDTIRRAKKLRKRGIQFLDAGVSGGPEGVRQGACFMVGGEKKYFEATEKIFYDMASRNGYAFFSGAGAGHFAKMVHNGIEYGMMQAIAEGFTILKKAQFKPSLIRIADVYNHGSVIESRLIAWLKEAFETYGEDLKNISGSVDQLGEGAWAAQTARAMSIAHNVITEAVRFRQRSKKHPSYTGKVLSALRHKFGGHDVFLQ